MRKPRKGEPVCNCDAYRFPHRFGGGKCDGFAVVQEAFASGHKDCHNCLSFNRDDTYDYCEVVEGQEKVECCPVYQEFVLYHEIRIYPK